MRHEVVPARHRAEHRARPLEVLGPEVPAHVRSLGIGEPHAAAAPFLPDRAPGDLVDERVQLARVHRGLAREVLDAEPGERLVAVVGRWDATALAVHEEVVALARRELLHPGHAFPAARLVAVRPAADGRAELVEVVEFAVGSGVDDDRVDARPLLAERGGRRVDHARVKVGVRGEKYAVAGPRPAEADEARGGPADLGLADDEARVVEERVSVARLAHRSPATCPGRGRPRSSRRTRRAYCSPRSSSPSRSLPRGRGPSRRAGPPWGTAATGRSA